MATAPHRLGAQMPRCLEDADMYHLGSASILLVARRLLSEALQVAEDSQAKES